MKALRLSLSLAISSSCHFVKQDAQRGGEVYKHAHNTGAQVFKEALRRSLSLAITASCHVNQNAQRKARLKNEFGTLLCESVDALRIGPDSPPAQTSWGRPR